MHRHVFEICLSIVLLGIVSSNCVSQVPVPPKDNSGTANRTETAVSAELEKQWTEKCGQLDTRAKDYPSRCLNILLDILAAAPGEQVEAEFKRIRSLEIGYDGMTAYDKSLLQAFVIKADREKDDTKLIDLLSNQCPRAIAAKPIEIYLTVREIGRIEILFDSYQVSTNEKSRAVLRQILEDSFKNFHEKFKNERDFIVESRKWFDRNKGKLKLNPYYTPRNKSALTGNLFIPK